MNNTYRVNISNKNLILQLNSPDATLESVGGKGAALARLVIASEVLSGIAQNFSPDTRIPSPIRFSCSLLGLAVQICSQITLHQASVRLTGATMSAKQPSYLFIEAVESHTQSIVLHLRPGILRGTMVIAFWLRWVD